MNVYIFLVLVGAVNGERILGVFTYPSISHQKVFREISQALSEKHELTVITTDPTHKNHRNLTQIDVSVGYDVFKYKDVSNARRDVVYVMNAIDIIFNTMDEAHKLELETQAIKELLKKPQDYFDLVLVEAHSPITYGFHHKFKAPLIAVSSLGTWSPIESIFGNSIHPFLHPSLFSGSLPYSNEMNLWKRIDSLYVTIMEWLYYKYFLLPRSDEMARTYFGNDVPSIETLMRNASMLFLNINPLFSDRSPTAPNVVYFHNLHHSTPEEHISNDLLEILDNTKTGVVYFSLGTNVRLDHIEGDFKEIVMNALGSLPYTILCKWESEEYPGKPPNVILRKWFPQQSVLAHPNIRVFVTQGGLQSAEEAIINAVPLVVIPFLADQPLNAERLQMHGMARTLSPSELTAQNLRDSILQVAEDEVYRRRARELRDIYLDQPQSGIDKIVWWCEYVIRHKGAKHLRSPGADIPLHEYFMLDILAVFTAVLLGVYIIIRALLRQFIRLLKNTNVATVGKKKQ